MDDDDGYTDCEYYYGDDDDDEDYDHVDSQNALVVVVEGVLFATILSK